MDDYTLDNNLCLATFDRRLDPVMKTRTALPCRVEVAHQLAVPLRRSCPHHGLRVVVLEDRPEWRPRARVLGMAWAPVGELSLEADLPRGAAVHIQIAVEENGTVRVGISLPHLGRGFGAELPLRTFVVGPTEVPDVHSRLEVHVQRRLDLEALIKAYGEPYEAPAMAPAAASAVPPTDPLPPSMIQESRVLRAATPAEIQEAQLALRDDLPSMCPDDPETWLYCLRSMEAGWDQMYDPQEAAALREQAVAELREGKVAAAGQTVRRLLRHRPPAPGGALHATGYGAVTLA